MRKMLITLALVAGPAFLAAQQPTHTPAKPAATQDTTKAKAKATARHRRPTTRAAHDSTKAKAKSTTPARDSTKPPS